MKKQGRAKPSEIVHRLNDQAVADYLLQHPEFFIRHAALVAQMRVPHPVRGSVSLVEWHMARSRDHISKLEKNMMSLMVQATENENLFQRLLRLQMRLTRAESLDEMLNHLQHWACELGLARATIRLFSDSWRLDAPSKFTHLALTRQAFEPVRIQRLGQQRHYLGPLNGSELRVMLPDPHAVGSVAMSLLGGEDTLGVILFISHDDGHYQPEQGTQMLQEIALMLPDLLARWIERR
ncbi:DUF484 domain-containing protein [Enterobacteriaceae bacterium ESL0689]|nr:DUF484 domain-containing protein [Enterobacteriaceae bacterium ESL0689]